MGSGFVLGVSLSVTNTGQFVMSVRIVVAALVRDRPTFWEIIFSFRNGQADVFEKNI